MAKQYHYVVLFDSETGKFELDWNSTHERFEEDYGSVWDSVAREWFSCSEFTDYENVGSVLSERLER